MRVLWRSWLGWFLEELSASEDKPGITVTGELGIGP